MSGLVVRIALEHAEVETRRGVRVAAGRGVVGERANDLGVDRRGPPRGARSPSPRTRPPRGSPRRTPPRPRRDAPAPRGCPPAGARARRARAERNASTSRARFSVSSQTALLSAPTKWSCSKRLSGSRTPRTVLSRTDSRLPSGPGLCSGQSASMSTSRGVGRPRLATSIFRRSRAFRDCHAASATGSPPRRTRNAPERLDDDRRRVVERHARAPTAERSPRAPIGRERGLGALGGLGVTRQQCGHELGSSLAAGLPSSRQISAASSSRSTSRGTRRGPRARVARATRPAPRGRGGRPRRRRPPRRCCGGALTVAARERDPAGGEQRVGMLHPGAERRAPARRAVRASSGSSATRTRASPAERRHETLDVAGEPPTARPLPRTPHGRASTRRATR